MAMVGPVLYIVHVDDTVMYDIKRKCQYCGKETENIMTCDDCGKKIIEMNPIFSDPIDNNTENVKNGNNS